MPKKRLHSVFGLLAAASFLLGFSLKSAQAELEVIVPAYFYPVPNSPWDDLNSAASQVNITAIMNPGSGPGVAPDSNYVAAVDSLRAAGGKVIGYVHTLFGARDLATVLSEIDDYAAWYNIDGIFIDEMSNTGPAGTLDYYRDIYNYMKGINPAWELTGNPGTNTLEQYLTWPTADRLIITENFGANYASFTPAAWVDDYQRSQFGNLIHAEPSSSSMEAQLLQAIANNAGSIYITDDVLPNPWDTLPSYWQAKIDAIEMLNNAILPGDTNEDLNVDADDLARWAAGYSLASGATHYDGDTDGDGDVDGFDFLQWQRNFGVPYSPLAAASAAAVPEPSGLVLAFFAYSCMMIWRRWEKTC